MSLRAATGVAAVGVASSLLLAGCGNAATKAPFSDSSAVGVIGLCNKAGHQVTSGPVSATPFAWRAVSSVAAPAPYNNDWRTAILLAYQPQQGLEADEWSGEEMTASSRYTNPAHPMAAATDGDFSLKEFVESFPPTWGGFIQLRLYLGTKDEQVYSVTYPTLDIQVSGNTWTAVGGRTVNCHSGTSESLETIVLPKSKTDPKASTTSQIGVPPRARAMSAVPAREVSAELVGTLPTITHERP